MTRRAVLTLGLAGLVLLLVSCDANRTVLGVSRGNTLFRKGEDSLALLHYFRALERAAGQTWEAWVRYNIGSSYVSLGELEAGIRALDQILGDPMFRDRFGDPQGGRTPRRHQELEFRLEFNRAVAAYERGAYAEAALGFAEALQIRPGSWDAKVNLELCLAEQASRSAAPVQRDGEPRAAEAREETRKLLDQLEREERPLWESSQDPQVFAEDW